MRPLIVMGVSGSGKTTLGLRLAEALGCRFVDADSQHPPSNIEKMRSGRPLDDADRAAWLETLNRVLRRAADGRIVLACSGLRAAYREVLSRDLPQVPLFIHLTGPVEVLRARLEARRGHFMPASLLDSQLATLEEPRDAIVVPIELPPGEQLALVIGRLESMGE
jgi:gluconokinase